MTFCILLLAGCAVTPNKEPDTEKDTSVKEPVTETNSRQFSSEADTSIDLLSEKIGENKALFGMAYIGYFDGAGYIKYSKEQETRQNTKPIQNKLSVVEFE